MSPLLTQYPSQTIKHGRNLLFSITSLPGSRATHLFPLHRSVIAVHYAKLKFPNSTSRNTRACRHRRDGVGRRARKLSQPGQGLSHDSPLRWLVGRLERRGGCKARLEHAIAFSSRDARPASASSRAIHWDRTPPPPPTQVSTPALHPFSVLPESDSVLRFKRLVYVSVSVSSGPNFWSNTPCAAIRPAKI